MPGAVFALCLNDSAHLHVFCSALARADEKLDVMVRVKLGQQYASHAVRLGQQAVESQPGEGKYWNTLGMAHCRAAEWSEAVRALEKSMETTS